MVLNDAGQGILVGDAANPGRQLRVPNGGVSANKLVIGGGPVDEIVSAVKAEAALRWLGSIPLHAVLGCHLPEIGFDDGGAGAAGEKTLVRAGAKVLLALGNELVIDALCGLPGQNGTQSGRNRDEEGNSGGTVHFVERAFFVLKGRAILNGRCVLQSFLSAGIGVFIFF